MLTIKRTFLARAAVTLLLAVLCSIGAWAQDVQKDGKIIVWLKDGTNVEVLFDEMPEFLYENGNVSLKGGTAEQSWPLANLKKFTFEPVPTIPIKMGDANNDGTIDANDVIEVVNYLMGKPSPSGNFVLSKADANEDGVINAADVVMIVNNSIDQ